ncbi:MAG: hypothetical protein Q9226_005454 [Calogaya cf. arnoldii]
MDVASPKTTKDATSKLAVRDKTVEHRSDLWAQAYQSLNNDDSRLVAALEDLLTSTPHEPKSPEGRASSARSSHDGPTPSRALATTEERMSTVIESRLRHMDDRKWRLRMGEHSIEIRERVDRITEPTAVGWVRSSSLCGKSSEDTLDECEEKTRALLITKFAALFSSHEKGLLKLLVTSRPSTPIGDRIWYEKIDPASIRLIGENKTEIKAISVEIDLVIREKIKQFNGLRQYRGVALIFRELEKCARLSEKKLLQVIEYIPTTVNQAYEGILSRSTDIYRARKLLYVILAAPRPLTLEEMNVALAMENDTRSVGQLDVKPLSSFRTTVRDLCGLFVNIRDSKIHLIHQTAKEFLVNSLEETVPSSFVWNHPMDWTTCTSVTVNLCLTFLSFQDFEINPFRPVRRRVHALELATRQYLEQYVFLEYAVKVWSNYLQDNYSSFDQAMMEKATRICKPNTDIYYFLEVGVDINAVDNHSKSALWWALEKGHERIAINHIRHMEGADIDFDAITILGMVALKGCTDVVHLLLDTGFKLHTKAKDGWTVCQRAAANGFVELLSSMGPNAFKEEMRISMLCEAAATRDQSMTLTLDVPMERV